MFIAKKKKKNEPFGMATTMRGVARVRAKLLSHWEALAKAIP